MKQSALRLIKVKVFWERLGLLGFHIQSVILCWEKKTHSKTWAYPHLQVKWQGPLYSGGPNRKLWITEPVSATSVCAAHIKVWQQEIIKKDTRQDGHCTCNTEMLLCDYCCIGKALSVTYCECVSIVLGIQYAMYTHRLFICGLSGPTIFFHLIS
jgi:hypothetical protein